VAVIVELRREGINLPLDRVFRHVRALKRFLPAGNNLSRIVGLLRCVCSTLHRFC